MSPHLAKLFAEAKSDQSNRENWAAFVRKSEMLDRHGEALIEALEVLVRFRFRESEGLSSCTAIGRS